MSDYLQTEVEALAAAERAQTVVWLDAAPGDNESLSRPRVTTSRCQPIARGARTEAQTYGAFVRRILQAMGRRVGDRDIEALPVLAELAAELDSVTLLAVANLYSHGYSWTDIGRALGITRQAARQRYAARLGESIK